MLRKSQTVAMPRPTDLRVYCLQAHYNWLLCED